MAKVQIISKNTTPFAGVFYVHDEFKHSGLRQLIEPKTLRPAGKIFFEKNMMISTTIITFAAQIMGLTGFDSG